MAYVPQLTFHNRENLEKMKNVCKMGHFLVFNLFKKTEMWTSAPKP